jgi:NAD-reducing hydrogenase small subunit
MAALKLATAWLGGCSGCHMSFLDMDEWLLELAGRVELVYSPLMDSKVYPSAVDLCLVEGAVANEDNRELLLTIRKHTRVLIAFGDCAVTGNVTAMRNPFGGAREVLRPVYLDNGDDNPCVPSARPSLPLLLDRVEPIMSVVAVDHYLPGCPPPAARIRRILEELLDDRASQEQLLDNPRRGHSWNVSSSIP